MNDVSPDPLTPEEVEQLRNVAATWIEDKEWFVPKQGDNWWAASEEIRIAVQAFPRLVATLDASRTPAALAQPEPLDAAALAQEFIHVRGAHNPIADELDGDQEARPCAWCRLAGEQAAEAIARLSETREG